MILQKEQTTNDKVRLPRNMHEQKIFGLTFDDIVLTAIKNHMSYDKENNPNYYTKEKDKWDKDVRLPIQKLLGLRKNQFDTKLQELISQKYIEDNGKEYQATNLYGDHHYYDIPKNTTMDILNHTVKKDTIKVYIYLLGWYNSKRKTNEKFTFSLNQLCELCGLVNSGQNCKKMVAILIALEGWGLIKINPTKKVICVNGINNSYYVLDDATTQMNLSENGAAKASGL